MFELFVPKEIQDDNIAENMDGDKDDNSDSFGTNSSLKNHVDDILTDFD